MSLLFFDGFDQYDAAADLTSFGGWAGVYNTGFDTFSTSVRTGTGKSAAFIANRGEYITLAEQSGNTLVVGFAYKSNAVGVGNRVLTIADVSGNAQMTVVLNTSNLLEIRLGNGGALLATGITTIAVSAWYYIEVKVLVANASGIAEVLVNGNVDSTFSGDTQSLATATVQRVILGGPSNGHAAAYDDFYVLNNVGSLNTTYLGEKRCVFLPPTSDSSVVFTHNTGATNYEAIDDLVGAPDDNTTYVYSATSTNKDAYGLTDIESGALNISGVKTNVRAEKDDVNPLSLKTGIKSGATDQQVTHTLGVGYANFINIFETSDGATTAFTETTANSLLATIEVV